MIRMIIKPLITAIVVEVLKGMISKWHAKILNKGLQWWSTKKISINYLSNINTIEEFPRGIENNDIVYLIFNMVILKC